MNTTTLALISRSCDRRKRAHIHFAGICCKKLHNIPLTHADMSVLDMIHVQQDCFTTIKIRYVGFSFE